MKNGDVIQFSYQEVPLEEAVNAVMAGDGNYSGIKATLLEALPNLPEGKAFAFGLPNGKEVAEKERRGICMALNSTLRKASLPWCVKYSGIKKLFICVPPKNRIKTFRPKTEIPETSKQMEALMLQTSKLFDIKPKDFKKGSKTIKGRCIRKAICIVATEMNIPMEIIASALGLTKNGVRFNATSKNPLAQEEAQRLRASLRR